MSANSHNRVAGARTHPSERTSWIFWGFFSTPLLCFSLPPLPLRQQFRACLFRLSGARWWSKKKVRGTNVELKGKWERPEGVLRAILALWKMLLLILCVSLHTSHPKLESLFFFHFGSEFLAFWGGEMLPSEKLPGFLNWLQFTQRTRAFEGTMNEIRFYISWERFFSLVAVMTRSIRRLSTPSSFC